MHAEYDTTLAPVIMKGPRLDTWDWADTYERFALIHNGEVVAVSNHGEQPYRDRMLRFYADIAKLECLPSKDECLFLTLVLDFHLGDRVSFQYDDTSYTGRIQDIFLAPNGKPEYVLDQFDPPIALDLGCTLAAIAEELTLESPDAND